MVAVAAWTFSGRDWLQLWFGSLAPQAPAQGSSVANAASPETCRHRPIIEAACKRLARVVSRFWKRATQDSRFIANLPLNGQPVPAGNTNRRGQIGSHFGKRQTAKIGRLVRCQVMVLPILWLNFIYILSVLDIRRAAIYIANTFNGRGVCKIFVVGEWSYVRSFSL